MMTDRIRGYEPAPESILADVKVEEEEQQQH